MDANKLLTFFAAYTDVELAAVRRSPEVDRFPSDPAVYTAIANEFFTDTNQDYLARHRLLRILREFLYYDGRTFDAMLTIAERTFQPPEFTGDGSNALAGISCYLDSGRPLPLSDEELLAKLGQWTEDEDLGNNARVCRDKILRRRPDMAGENI
jgi:hypothetical protein